MSIHEVTTYKCDACGQQRCLDDLPDTWVSVRTNIVWTSHTRRSTAEKVLHACSASCEKQLYLELAKAEFDAEQLEAEAMARQPDLAGVLRQSELEISTLREKIRGLEHELDFSHRLGPVFSWLRRRLLG